MGIVCPKPITRPVRIPYNHAAFNWLIIPVNFFGYHPTFHDLRCAEGESTFSLPNEASHF